MLGKTSGKHGEVSPCVRFFSGGRASLRHFSGTGPFRKGVVELIHSTGVKGEVRGLRCEMSRRWSVV